MKFKSLALIGLTVIAIIAVFQFPPIGQPAEFHDFADGRRFLGIRNLLNILSNLPFLLISIYGFHTLYKNKDSVAIRWIYSILFLAVGSTALGSAWYQSNPDNNTLVWDRMPMTIIFMSLTCATIAEFIDEQWGLLFLILLVPLGVGSVLWWHCTEMHGRGDLRLYFLVQYYPMVCIPLILCLYYQPHRKPLIEPFMWIVSWYVIAKLFERWDIPIYKELGISGHTLKHLAAAASTWYFVEIYKKRTAAA